MENIDKINPGDVVVKVDRGAYSLYTKHFTYDKEYTALSPEECNQPKGDNYVLNDNGNIVILHDFHFKISRIYQRNETITDILS